MSRASREINRAVHDAEVEEVIRSNERNDPVEHRIFMGVGAAILLLFFYLAGAGMGGTIFGGLLGADIGHLIYRNLFRLKVYAMTAAALAGGVAVLVFLVMHW